jgi:hypothetical protein
MKWVQLYAIQFIEKDFLFQGKSNPIFNSFRFPLSTPSRFKNGIFTKRRSFVFETIIIFQLSGSWYFRRNCNSFHSFLIGIFFRNIIVVSVARWFIFKPKIPIWVIFVEPWNGKCWYRYFMTIWYILRPFGIFYGHLV